MKRRESILLAVKVLLQKGYEWLACDKDGTIVAYEVKPFKMTEEEWWNYNSEEPKLLILDNAHDINFVKWEDEESTNIAEWIKKEEEEMMNRREARFASVSLLLGSGYLWLARDLNGSIAAYSHKPFKLDDEVWYNEIGESKVMWMWVDDGDLYNFVKWEDDEPVNIREWLEKEAEELKLYYVRNGELECREVTAENWGKSATLGGLLTPKEVELDMDNRIVSDDTTDESKGDPLRGFLEALAKIDLKLIGVDDMVKHDFKIGDLLTPKFDKDNVHAHLEVCGELNVTYERKNADYGASFAQSLDKHGLIAAIVRMDDKMNRVINLYKADERLVEDESVRDTLMDLANYAIMSVMWLDTESANESDGGYMSPTEYNPVALLDSDSYLLAPGEAFRAGFGAGISGSTDRDIYADNQKLDIDKALREGAHPQAIRDFLGGADYDGDATNS